jgi:hypothetical protein
MSGAISQLLRLGLGLIAGGDFLKNGIRRAIGAAILYAAAALFALAALIFAYVFLDRWLTRVLDDDVGAAAILAGANLIIVAFLMIARAMAGRTPRRKSPQPGLLNNANLEAGIAVGAALSGRLRKAAPTVALVIGVLGLALGARPELLNLFKTKPKDRSGGR